jgi:2-methylcitrate dehydratase PrpD
MKKNIEKTPIEKLADNIISTRYENFDQDTIDFTKTRIIDTLGCLIGGANAPGNAGLIGVIKDWAGKEESTILIHGIKAPAINAAIANCIMSRSFDFEPVGPMVEGKFWPGHISGTSIPTAITLGEAKGISGKELITALLVGEDLASRLLASSGFNFDDGWDNIGTVNAFGATAIAGRILGLDQDQIRYALGIALNQIGGTLQNVWDKTTSFKICNGLSARNGIFSAQLAKAGWTGPEDILFGQFNYYKNYTTGCLNPQYLTNDLGKKYYSDGTIKPYPCCRNNHAAIDVSLNLAVKNNLKPIDIQELTLFISPEGLRGFCGGPYVIGKFPQANAIWSYRYNVATALLKRSVKPENFTEASLHDPEVFKLASRVNLAEIPGADFYTAKLEVSLKNGTILSEYTNSPRGEKIRNPLTKDEIMDKFWNNVDFSKSVTSQNARKLVALLEDLEHLENVRQIVELLVVK